MGDRYVSPAGNDGNTGRTRNDPFATLQKGVDEIAAEGGGTLFVALGVYVQNTGMVGSQYSNITIVGDPIPVPDPEFPHRDDCDVKARIDGGRRGPVFVVAHARRVTFRNLTIENGYAPLGGGVLGYRAQFDIDQCCVRRNHADYGGGIDFYTCDTGSTSTISDSKIYANEATELGGGVRMWRSSHVEVVGTDLFDNAVQDGNGGGIAIVYGTMIDVRSCRLRGNKARNAPGVIGAVRFFKGTGGAIYAARCTSVPVTVTIQRCSFVDNLAGFGGAISIQRKAYATIDRCMFEENVAREDGGGIFVGQMDPIDVYTGSVNLWGDAASGKLVRIQGCDLVRNRAGDDGGGVSTTGGSVISIADCRFTENKAASNGGAVSVTWVSFMDMSDAKLVGNSANRMGGGVTARNSDVIVRAATVVRDNRCSATGGGIQLYTMPESSTAWYDFNGFMRRSGYNQSRAFISGGNLIAGNAGGTFGGGIFALRDRGGHQLSATVQGNRVGPNQLRLPQGLGQDMYFERVGVIPATPAQLGQANPPSTPATVIVV